MSNCEMGPNEPEKKVITNYVYQVSPDGAVDEYLEERAQELRKSTIRSYRKHLRFFVKWCELQNIEFMSAIDGFKLKEFKNWRKLEGNNADDVLGTKTFQDNQRVLRSFIEWCEQTDYVRDKTSEKVRIPNVKNHQQNDTKALPPHMSHSALKYAEKFHYASPKHVTFLLLVETGARPGGIRSLDVSHYQKEGNEGILKFRDDPDNGLRLKNGTSGERNVLISSHCCEILDDYIEHSRKDVEDKHGRTPLLVAGEGRIGKSTIRKYCYELTRPCVIQDLCPSGKEQDGCDGYHDRAHKCPDKYSPKSVRKGYITEHIRNGLSIELISERCDVSPKVIEKHYNKMSKEEEQQQRRQEIQDISQYWNS